MGRTVARVPRRRRHWFEFEDLAHLPSRLRDGITDWLQQCVVLEWDVYHPTAPLIADLMQRAGSREVVDLCAGAGGPWPTLKPALEEIAGDTSLLLTDKYPNTAAFQRTAAAIGDGRTSHLASSVDALAVPAELTGARTLFTAVHHLRPMQVRGVLRDAYERRVPIGAFDFCGREQVLPTLRMGVLPMLKTMHRVRPRRPLQLALTYLLPVLPVMILWDATVSNLRAYTPDELEGLVSDLDAPDWRWEVGRLASTGQPVTFVRGYPTT